MEGTPKRRSEMDGTPKRRGRPSLGQPVRMKAKRTPRMGLDDTFDNIESSAPRGAATPPSSKRPASARQHLADSGSCSKSGAKAAQRSLFGRPPPASACNSMRKSHPMPVGDKNYTKTCAEDVFEFLNNHHFGRGITPDKVFKGVSTREFFDMFQFIYHKLDPEWVFDGKPEDDIPMIMKIKEYPSDVNKSKLQAISGPNAWPQLLAILQFLVKRHTVYEVFEEDEREKLATVKKMVGICMEAYDVWIADGDPDIFLRQKFDDLKDASQHRLASTEDNIAALSAAIADKERHINELESSQSVDQVRAETNSMQNTLSSQVQKDELIRETIESESKHLEEMDAQIEELSQELASITDTVKNQPFTRDEVEHYRHENRLAEESIKEREAENRRIEKEIAETRKLYSQKVQECRFSAQRLNSRLEEMAACGPFKEFTEIDHAELRAPDDCTSNDAEFSKCFAAIQNFTKAVKPEILRCCGEVQNQMHVTEEDIHQKTHHYKSLESDLKNGSEDLMAIQQAKANQRQMQQDILDTLSNEMRAKKAEVIQTGLDKPCTALLERNIAAANLQLKSIRATGKAELKAMDEALAEDRRSYEELQKLDYDSRLASIHYYETKIAPRIEALPMPPTS